MILFKSQKNHVTNFYQNDNLLLKDIDNPNQKNRNCSYYLSASAFVKTVKPTPDKKLAKRFTLKKSKKINEPKRKKKIRYSSDDTESEVHRMISK